MVFPLLGLASGHIARFGLSTVMKQGSGQFVQALPFGAGYSLGTYLGFPKNYESNTYNKSKSYSITLPSYGNYNRGYSNYGRSRKIRVWSRKYRRYIWVYPRRRY